jgi:alpha-beta hydrolase superfamily lysophospholipase
MTVLTAKDVIMARDGLRLACLRVEPHAPINDVIVHLHGLESHNGWLGDFAQRLATAGLAFLGLDRRGSGESEGPRGDAPSLEALLDDVERGIAQARRWWPTARIHLLGLCLGARTAVLCAGRSSAAVDSVVLVSPSFYLAAHNEPSLVRRLGLTLDAWLRPTRRHPSPLADAMFSSIPAALEFLARDEKKLKEASARFLFDLFGRVTTRRLLKTLAASRVPVLVICAADRDRVLNTAVLLRSLRVLQQECPRLKVEVFPHSEHLIYFDAPAAVVSAICDHVRPP